MIITSSTKKQLCDPSANTDCIFEAESADVNAYCKLNNTDQRCLGSEPGNYCLKITDKDCHFPLTNKEIDQKCKGFVQDHRCPGTSWYCTIVEKYGNKTLCKGVNTLHDPEVCYAAGKPACVKPLPSKASDGTDFCKKYTNDYRCYSERLGFLPVYPNFAFCESQFEEKGKWINPCITNEGDIGSGCYKNTDYDCNNKTMTEAEIEYLCMGLLQQRDLRCPRRRGEGCDKPVDADCTTTSEPTTTVTTTFPTTPVKKSNSKLDVNTSAPVEQTSLQSHQSSIISLSIGIASAFVISTAY